MSEEKNIMNNESKRMEKSQVLHEEDNSRAGE